MHNLTEEQMRAVRCQKNLRLIACPGSGKTTVLAYRIGYWIHQGLAPNKTLCLTFTRKAAREMKDRISKLVGVRSRGVLCGTFHSVFLRFLIKERALRDPEGTLMVIDELEQRRIVEGIILECRYEEDLEEMVQYIELKKNELYPPRLDLFQGIPTWYKKEEVYELYQRYLEENDLLDFTEILVRTHDLLRDFCTARAKIRKRYGFICVDEYHDTNKVQFEILRLITGDGAKSKISVVGDPKQSIYSWRGSNPKFLMGEFEKHFTELETLELTQNFRSTGNIVRFARTVLNQNPMQTLNPLGPKVTILRCRDEKDQAERVTKIIQKLVEQGFSYRSIAVLYRKNCQSEAFIWECLLQEIPFEVKDDRFFNKKISLSFLAMMVLDFYKDLELLVLPLFLFKALSLSRTKDKVSLMTFHSSKGLEFPVAFVTNLQEDCIHFDPEDEEERRLLYVAVTRAKKKLFCSYHGTPNRYLIEAIYKR